MELSIPIKIIATIHTDFPDKFGIPRQSGIADKLQGTIVFQPEYRNPDALRGLEDFSHIWLLWHFSEVPADKNWSATVRPPRLGGNTRMGVFATRSPFRPNPIGLSCVKIQSIEQHPSLGPVIHVQGADLMDGTPILDIKPYLPHADCHPEAASGFAGQVEQYSLQVEIPPHLLDKIPDDKRPALIQVLAHDPRPSYHNDRSRVYGMNFANFEVHFTVTGENLQVCDISFLKEK